MCYCLDDECKLVVKLRDLTQCGRVFGILGHGEHFGLQGIFDRNADVVDGWRRRGLIGRIDPDGIGQFDRAKWEEVRNQPLRNLMEKDCICAKYLNR